MSKSVDLKQQYPAYLSDIDILLFEIRKKSKKTESELEEIRKYQKITQLRDKVE